jgi:urate oxidase
MKKNGKKGQILTENIIFIVLNLIFLSILVLFVYSKSGGEAVLEEKYAKQIALVIDSAKPSMKIHLNMEDAYKKAESNGFDNRSVVSVDSQNNIVNVKLRNGNGYSYNFFNDVDVFSYYDGNGKVDYVIREVSYKS